MTDGELASGLYLVATPLGNLGDLSQRARETLSRASFVAGENTKVVLRWMEILEIPKGLRPGVLSYRESSREKDARRILDCLEQEQSVALITDAGTPAISDPGWHLVTLTREAGFPVWAVPGPCAAVAALSASGFPCRNFYFEGFLAASGSKRRQGLERAAETDCPVVFYESPHRLLASLSDFSELFPARELFVSREMTKKFEESWRGTCGEALSAWSEKTIKGEFTLILGPACSKEQESGEVPEETLALVQELGLPTKSATKLLKHFFPSADKKALYRSLQRKD